MELNETYAQRNNMSVVVKWFFIYIAVLIVSIFIKPWGNGIDNLPEALKYFYAHPTFADTVTFKVLAYGLGDMLNFLIYLMFGEGDLSLGRGCVLLLVMGAFAGQKIIFERYNDDKEFSSFENALLAFFTDNVFAYVINIIVIKHHEFISNKIDSLFTASPNTLLIVIITIPMLLALLLSMGYSLYLVVYLFGTSIGRTIFLILEIFFAGVPILGHIVIFIAAVFITYVIELVVGVYINKISHFPAKQILNIIMLFFGA